MPSKKNQKAVLFYDDADFHQALKDAASQKGLSKSAFIRMVLRQNIPHENRVLKQKG